MNNSPQPNLKFILDTLETIRKYTPNNKDAFMNDPNAQDATLMRLQDIGEQLARIRDRFPDFYEQYDSDEWHKIIGLRNIISHGYREIDFEIIWDIVTNMLADFTAGITRLIV
jgi:uncharacterized protein with HEPN domain